MHGVVVEFEVKPPHAGDFRERVLQQAADSLAREPDCHVFDVCVDPQRAERILLYEVYTDEAAFAEHLASSHFKAFDADVAAWLDAKRVESFTRIE